MDALKLGFLYATVLLSYAHQFDPPVLPVDLFDLNYNLTNNTPQGFALEKQLTVESIVRQDCDGPAKRVINKWCQMRATTQWKAFEPEPRYSHDAAAYSRGKEFGNLRRMLVFGGVGPALGYEGKTWTFLPWSGSWVRIPETSPSPITRKFHTLTTLCDAQVVLIGGVSAMTRQVFNDTWIFDGKTETWNEVRVVAPSNESEIFLPRNRHTANAVLDPESPCSCKESVLIFGGVSDNGDLIHYASRLRFFNELWMLRCVSEGNEISPVRTYQYKKITSRKKFWPRARAAHAAAYSTQRHALYVWGGQSKMIVTFADIWIFNLRAMLWEGLIVPDDVLGKAGSSVYAKGIYVAEHEVILYLATSGNPLVLDTRTNQTAVATNDFTGLDYLPLLLFSAVKIEKAVMVYGGLSKISRNTRSAKYYNLLKSNLVWNFTMTTKTRYYWQRNAIIMTHPNVRDWGVNYYYDNNFYLFGGVLQSGDTFTEFKDDYLWVLNLKAMTWWKYKPEVFPRTVSSASWDLLDKTNKDRAVLVLHGGTLSSIFNLAASDETWGYHLHTRMWTKIRRRQTVLPRAGHTMVSLGNHSFLLFGGVVQKRKHDAGLIEWIMANDMWIVTVDDSYNSEWFQLFPINQRRSRFYPPPVKGHKAFIREGRMFIISGMLDEQTVFYGLWSYHIRRQIWECLHSKTNFGDRLFFIDNLFVEASTTEKLFAIGNLTLNDANFSLYHSFGVPPPSIRALLTLHIKTNQWTILQYIPTSQSPAGLFSFKETLKLTTTMFDLENGLARILKITPGCFRGYHSANFSYERCLQCPVGTFSLDGAEECSKCPKGLTTKTARATSIGDCICRRDYCSQGTCVLVNSNNVPAPFCKCKAGFTGNRCEYPTYYLVTLGIAVLLTVVLLSILLMRNMKKSKTELNYTKQELDDTEKKRSALDDVWQINWSEIKILSQLNSGGSGDVYKGEYRELTIAVKKLKDADYERRDRFTLEFQREIELMKTTRHPNIVLFIGGGQIPEDGCPFLVLEYLSRGDLGTILRNTQIPIRELQFALDIAKGMQFLHNLSPPQVHRDLKSNNLLVSERWVVKVADFGQARLVSTEKIAQESRTPDECAETNDETVPLLMKPNRSMTTNLGTLLWRSPELFERRPYGTPTDVYR